MRLAKNIVISAIEVEKDMRFIKYTYHYQRGQAGKDYKTVNSYHDKLDLVDDLVSLAEKVVLKKEPITAVGSAKELFWRLFELLHWHAETPSQELISGDYGITVNELAKLIQNNKLKSVRAARYGVKNEDQEKYVWFADSGKIEISSQVKAKYAYAQVYQFLNANAEFNLVQLED